jgi:hypothetical protein
MLSKLFPFLALVLVAASPATAQQARVSLRFLAFPAQNPPEPVELLVGEGKTMEVDTPGHELSPPYQVAAMNEIIVGRTITDSEGKPSFQILGRAKGISAPEQIILLLRKGAEHSDGFVVLPIAADLTSFSGGSFLFINASSLPIKGTIGNLELNLAPAGRKVLSPRPDFAGDVCQVTFSYLRDDKFKRFYDTRWSASKDVRSLVLFYQNPQTGRLGIAPIMDIIPRKSPQGRTP